MESFTNNQLSVGELPQVENLVYQPLEESLLLYPLS